VCLTIYTYIRPISFLLIAAAAQVCKNLHQVSPEARPVDNDFDDGVQQANRSLSELYITNFIKILLEKLAT
jgi:hypothetical protein